jgi:hypothetical protein
MLPVAVTSLLLGHALHAMIPESDKIDDPNNPGELAGLQKMYNAAAIQVSPRAMEHLFPLKSATDQWMTKRTHQRHCGAL